MAPVHPSLRVAVNTGAVHSTCPENGPVLLWKPSEPFCPETFASYMFIFNAYIVTKGTKLRNNVPISGDHIVKRQLTCWYLC